MNYIYFDEAGYTGADLTNEAQPYFVLASVRFSAEEIDTIRRNIGLVESTKEIHFKNIHTNRKGWDLLNKLFLHPLLSKGHIKIGVAQKRYCIYAQIVDTIIETYYYSRGVNLYANHNNLKLANLLYSFSVSHENQELVSHLEKSFVKMVRKNETETIEEFYSTVDRLINEDSTTVDAYRELLSMISSTKEDIDDTFVKDNPFYLDNTLSLFIALVEKWYLFSRLKDNIIFDDSKPIASQKIFIEQLRDMNVPETKVGYAERKHVYPLPIGTIQLSSSADYFGIQIADAIASAIFFILTNKNEKLKQFKQNLQNLELFRDIEVLLVPSTAEQLSKNMDDSLAINPLDFICSHLEQYNEF